MTIDTITTKRGDPNSDPERPDSNLPFTPTPPIP